MSKINRIQIFRVALLLPVAFFFWTCGSKKAVNMEKTPRTVGKIETIDGKQVLSTAKGEGGFLMYGPYIPMTEGNWRLTVKLSAEGPIGAQVGWIDVHQINNVDKSDIELSTRKIIAQEPGDVRQYNLEFDTTGESKYRYEFRINTSGAGPVRVYSVEYQRI